MKKLLLFINIILFAFSVEMLAQSFNFSKAGNTWYFGQGAGLDFNSGSPVPLTDGQLNTFEGCASISDINGDILFYTDGSIVYNKNHTVMPNGSGLWGHNSSSQSAIIVKKPGSSNIYYIFTVDGYTGWDQGLNYSEVDMSLDGGLGDITLNKNISLIQYASEKVTAVRHDNGSDFWIVSRADYSSEFQSFLLSSNGVDNTPIISNSLSYQGATSGYLRASQDGSRIAVCYAWFADELEVYDFDNQTGVLSNPVGSQDMHRFYGIEFSPDGNLLYATSWNHYSANGKVMQYDLNTSPLNAFVLATFGSSVGLGAIQLGPDNKLYVAEESATDSIGVINDPNNVGLSCNYTPNSISLGGRTCKAGLPTFYNTIYTSSLISTPGCTDPAADNYDASATMDDGSCVYNNCNSISGFNYIGTIGSCCYYEYNDTTTWTAANILCINNGGSLVSINTIQESDSLNLLLGNNNTGGNQHWINLIDGSSTWENGEPLSFTNYDGSYSAVSGDYMFLQNNGFWDNSPNDGSQSNDGIYPLMEICSPATTTPIISNAFISQPIMCYGGFATDEMQIEITQTTPPTTYALVIGSYTGSYFLSYISTNQTTGTLLNINGFLPNVDYFVRVVDSTAYYNGNGGVASGISSVGIYDEFGPINFYEPAQLVASTSVVDSNMCNGDCIAEEDLTISGGTMPYSFDITDINGTTTQNLANGVSSYSFVALCADNYDVVVTDANGCSTSPATTNFVIAPIAPIVPAGTVSIFNMNGYNVSCNGLTDGSITAIASGGTGVFTYSIDGINFQSNSMFSGLSAGTYTITYKDANGCIETEQLTLNEPPNLSGTANITQIVDCFGASTGEITFDVDPLNPGVPPYQYSTDNGSNYQSSNIFNNLAGNITYNVMIEDNNGCQYTSLVFINEPPALSASASVVDASCYGLSDGIVTINISGGTPNYTINAFGVSLPLSSSSFTTPSGVPAGNYPYSIVDANNCPFNDVIIVGEPALISSTDNVTTCGNYTWIDGNTYTSNNNTATYTYNAVNGCDSVVILNLNLTPNITNTVVDTACGEYLFGANFIDTSGTYNDIFTSAGGCDSIVTLELTIFEDSSVTYITACDSAEWNGVWYFNDTIVTDTGFYTSYAFGGATATNSGKEGNIWYFGANAGLDFNSGSPVPLLDGQLYTFEGCASICDNNGDLLFYTDGMSVYNKNHILMPNGTGLLGNTSSTQSSIIIRKPGSSTIYFIITVDGYTGSGGGLNYSEVDMTLDGGLGDINSNKNINLIPYTLEKVTAIEHQNGTDFWIISPENNTNIIYSFLLTSAGINLTPVLTNGQGMLNGVGYLKGSPDGTKVALVNANGAKNVQLYDFDNASGILTYNLSISFSNFPYGIEFSPNSKLLYVSEWTNASVWQIDLLAGTNTSIINSAINLGTSGLTGGALQLAPDNKIYQALGDGWAPSFATHLPVINNPDNVGVGCNFSLTGASLGGKYSIFGLPTFFSSIFNTPPSSCDSVATAIIDIKNSSSTYTQVAQCDSFTWVLNGQTYYSSQIDTIQSTNIDGCQYIDSLDLTIHPAIDIIATIDDELCVDYSDGSIMLNVSGGYGAFSYNWNGPNSFSATAKDIFNLSPGTYNLTITDITSLCIKDTFFVIGAGFDMQLTSTSTDVSCYGFNDGSIDINSINLINPIYTWYDISTSLEDRINMSPGIYYLQIDDNNCFVRDTFIITQPDSLFIISQQTTSVCLGDNSGEISVQTFGGTPGYDYYWSNWNVNSPINSNLSSGIYDLDIYDDNDCLFEETFEILSYQIIVSSVVDNIDCFSGNTGSIDLTVSGGFPTYTYLWSDNSINEDIYNLSAGSVTCTISDYLGCENIVSFNLTQEPQLSSIPAVTGVSCYGGSDGSASLLITGGVSAYNIDWNNADENNLEEGYYPYEITDANGCTFNDTVYIPQEDSLILDIITIDLQCNGDPTGKIDAIVLSGGVYPYTYSWVGPNNFTANQYIINNLYAGLYTLTVSDANSCDVEFQITLSQPTAVSQDIDFEFSNYSNYEISCMNGSDGWINALPTGGFIPYSFDWSGPNSFNSANQNITNLSEGMYNVTITNGLGCDTLFSFPMNDPIDAPSGVVNSLYDYHGYDVSCYGFNDGGIIVEANGGVSPYTYVWDNVQTLNPLPFQESGMHLLTMYDNNGCEWESFIVLNQPDELIWTIEIFPDTCEREVGAIKIELEGGILPYNYLWNDGQTTFEANQLFEGEYNVQVIDKNGCQIFDTIQVSNLVAPKMDFAIMSDYEKLYKQLEDPIVFIDMTELTWQNALYWDWDFGDGTYGTDSIAFHSYQEIGEYDVLLKVTTDYNCIDTLVKKVIIEEYDLFIPNAFTPNSSDDNINEEFRPFGFGISEFQMNIYSRWGGLIFSTTNIEDGWNGKFDNSGAEVQLGVYVYYIKTKDVFGALHEYTGEVNLIR